MLITTDVLQEGEDLHLFCSRVYHYGLSWTPSSMEQRVGRIDRVRSHTHRRLEGLRRQLIEEEKLQVFYPPPARNGRGVSGADRAGTPESVSGADAQGLEGA